MAGNSNRKKLLTANVAPPMMKTLGHEDMRCCLKTNSCAGISLLGERLKGISASSKKVLVVFHVSMS